MEEMRGGGVKCFRCEIETDDVKLWPSMTAYTDGGKTPDELLNPDVQLCPKCYGEYEEYWREMWQEYYNQR